MLLNLDAGEHDDEPAELWALADILCVACGGHAGDSASMTRLVQFIAAHPNVRLGAHPSYADREGFGRRTQPFDATTVSHQLRELATIAGAHGVAIHYVKPHGALYHDAAGNPALAHELVRISAATLGVVTMIGPGHGALASAAREQGLGYLREGFADRAARPDGTLVPRGEPGALITEPTAAAARARDLGKRDSVDTICCHADTPGALAIVRAVRAAL